MIEKRSYLENIMKRALEESRISYKEQYCVNEKPGDFVPKYTLDFLVFKDNIRIDVECDGTQYHSNYNDVQKDKYRDAWLLKNGIVDRILRYDTVQITNNIQFCINEILAMLSNNTREKQVNKKTVTKQSKKYIFHVPASEINHLHKVDIYTATLTYSYEKKLRGAIAFQLIDRTLKKSSDIYAFAYIDINRKESFAIVILEALLKMKRPAYLTIHTESKWIETNGNERYFELHNRKQNNEIWHAVGNELIKHNYNFKYQPYPKRDTNPIYTVVTKNDEIYRQLKSKVRKELFRGNEFISINEVLQKIE